MAYLSEKEFKKILKKLRDIMKPDVINKINSLINSLYCANEDLEKSRNNWRDKFKILNDSLKTKKNNTHSRLPNVYLHNEIP